MGDRIRGMKKKLPIGIQSIKKIIIGGYAYVDKTGLAHELLKRGEYYFIIRTQEYSVL
ncbi:hypothetical protein NEPTK9_001669 [Candidatus Neptunochlamydia vexilliferae]|uniref:AAA-ATPase-like domain-containing protein n=2 Tax=Candidatus Neptunichlamydia vexilliferae TaxID=1651774 RepID=A0ABS0B165_9BACT|nr:hypothetical protein [Candidatus Neptunochlamydia vexilliferae]